MGQVVVEMSGDEAKLFRAYQRIIDQSSKLDSATKQNKVSHEQAFGDQSLSQLAAYAGRFVGLATILGSVASAMGKVREEADQLAARQREAFGSVGMLAQLAQTPGQMQQLVGGAEQLYRSGAAPNMGQAANLQFAISSAGMEQYSGDIGRLAASGMVPNVVPMVNAAAALQSSLGAEQTGGFGTIISRALGASAGSPASTEAILQAAALSGPQASALGISSQELLAGVGTLSKPAGSAEQAGTLLESFLKQIEKEGINETRMLKPGRTMMEYVQDISALEEGGTNVRSILGNRQEAITGYRLLRQNQALFGENMANISSFEQGNAFERNTGFSRDIPSMEAVRARQERMAEEETGQSQRGTWSNIADVVQADLQSRMRGRYGNLMAAGEGGLSSLGRWALGDEQWAREGLSSTTAETQARIAQILESIERNTRADGARARAAAGSQPE